MLTNTATVERLNRDLAAIGDQLAYFASCMEQGRATDALHHSAYVGQVLPWQKKLTALLSDVKMCAQLTLSYPYWTTQRLQSVLTSLAAIEGSLAPHHAGRHVDKCWVMHHTRPLAITQDTNLILAAAIRAELG